MLRNSARRPGLLLFLLVICLGAGGFNLTAAAASQADTNGSLQRLIDQTRSGDTIVLPAGDYKGPLVIKKPLRLEASGTVRIQNESDQPTIFIQSNQTRLSGIVVIDTATKDSAAIVVMGNNNVLENLQIETRSSGIQLRDADRNVIHKTYISWLERGPIVKLSDKGNGIDLYNSNENVMSENVISKMHDGIYLEKSNQLSIEYNQVDHSRYGIHCMYTSGTAILNNRGSYNVTGAMVMGATHSEVRGNTFSKQSENVNSQGLLLYDVQTSTIRENLLEGNRVGMYVEESRQNELIDNRINLNFIGLQMKTSEQNHFARNQFNANVIQAEATDSQNNVEGNYWDNFQGIDLDQNGYSDITYAVNPFFQQMTKAIPPFQLFFQSPGMVFLENMFTSNQASWTKDKSPLMKPPLLLDQGTTSATQNTFWFSVLLLGTAVFTILYLGVKRS